MLKYSIGFSVFIMFLSFGVATAVAASPPENSTLNTEVEEAPNRFWSGVGQVGGGLLAGATLAGASVLILDTLYQGDGDIAAPMMGLGILAGAVGTTLGVWVVGEWIGWDGSLGATAGGLAVGVLVSGLVGSGLLAISESVIPAVVAFGLGVPTAGAIGYHLSADWPTGSNALLAPNARTFTVVNFEF